MSDNWVVQNLENALNTWNEKLAEIWQLITQSPEDFKGGAIWGVIQNIYGALQMNSLPPFYDVNAPNTARKDLIAMLINNIQARTYLLTLNSGFQDTLTPGEDTLIYSGFSKEEAAATTSAFERYCPAYGV